MNQTIKFNELTQRFYIFYLSNGKPTLLKKDTESQMLCSIDRLKNKGVDALLGVDLETMTVYPFNYNQLENYENIGEPCTMIVKDNHTEQYFIMSVGDNFKYDVVVYLSMGNFIMINRREKTYMLERK